MDNYLYLLLNLGSVSIPLLYSIFEKDFYFIQYFKIVLLSIFLVAIPFLIWDFIFTVNGIWGFNQEYHLPFKILKMPLEEWLFFFCIPYACLFTHEVIKNYWSNFKLSKQGVYFLSFLLIIFSFVVFFLNLDKWYTCLNFLFYLTLMLYSIVYKRSVLQEYLPTFIVILIPFFLVNGILTGSFIEGVVVWYNDAENMGVRIATIPLEDVFYAFNLLFSIQLVFNYLKDRENI